MGVKNDTLKNFGAVSYQTAIEMAKGVRTIMKTDIGISTTGIAGPGGGSKEKPVGTVYIGFSFKEETGFRLLSLNPSLSRDEIREETVKSILKWVIEKI